MAFEDQMAGENVLKVGKTPKLFPLCHSYRKTERRRKHWISFPIVRKREEPKIDRILDHAAALVLMIKTR